MPTAVAAAGVRFLALGDSYTIGEAVSSADRWPERLAGALRARGVAVSDPTIVAQTGWTADELLAGIDSAQPSGQFGLITLLIGVNDQYRGASVNDFRPRFNAVLARAIALAGGASSRVVVVSIPDWGVTPFAASSGRDRAHITAEIDVFNAVCRAEADRAGAHFVDVTPLSRRAAADRSLVAADGLHPSGVMYKEWARLILPAALRALDTGRAE